MLQTQNLLKRPCANLGTAGYGPLEELAVLESFGLAKRPRCVVWQLYEGNDLSDVVNYIFWETAGGKGRSELSSEDKWDRRYRRWKRSSPFVRLVRSMTGHQRRYKIAAEGEFRLADGKKVSMRFAVLPNKHMNPLYSPIRWQKIREAILRCRTICGEKNIRLLIVVIPIKLRVLRDFVDFGDADGKIPVLDAESHFSRVVRETCENADIAFLDPTMEFRKQAQQGKIIYFAYDTHLAPNGHRKLAELLSARIAQSAFGMETR
ncbi:MAG: hypothetical protein IID45_15870 [Planctomycetes bacterium]|nr:hypothetical protein [Planctomycetota bacterium]